MDSLPFMVLFAPTELVQTLRRCSLSFRAAFIYRASMQLALIGTDISEFLIPCQLQGYYPCLRTWESLAATDAPFVPQLDFPVNCRVIRPGDL